MPTRMPVPPPAVDEESRLLAEQMADLEYTLQHVAEYSTELIPGESIDDFRDAWHQSQAAMSGMVTALAGSNIPNLDKAELMGAPGRAKRNALGRAKDLFFMWWNSDPRTDEKRAKAAEAVSNYLELGSTVVSSIPGYEHVVEFLSLTKQLVTTRWKRGS